MAKKFENYFYSQFWLKFLKSRVKEGGQCLTGDLEASQPKKGEGTRRLTTYIGTDGDEVLDAEEEKDLLIERRTALVVLRVQNVINKSPRAVVLKDHAYKQGS